MGLRKRYESARVIANPAGHALPPRAAPFSLEDLLVLVLVAGSYFLCGKFGLKFAAIHPSATALWAPTGIALAACLIRGRRVWLAVFAGALLVNIFMGSSLLLSLGIAAGNTAEAVAGAYLVRKYANGVKAFFSPRDVLRFAFLAGLVSTAISATVGVGLLLASGNVRSTEASAVWLVWWIGDVLGALTVTPFLILLLGNRHHPTDLWERVEATLLLIGLCFACLFNFGPLYVSLGSDVPPIFLCAPFLVWAALRFCPLEAAGTIFILCGFATWGSWHGYGTFAHSSGVPLLLAGYLSVVGLCNMSIAAAIWQHKRKEEELVGSLYLLDEAKESRIRELSAIVASLREGDIPSDENSQDWIESEHVFHRNEDDAPEVLWFLDAESEEILYVSPAYEAVWGRSRETLYADPHAWLDAVHPEDHESALAFFGPYGQGPHVETNYRVVRPDGSVRWIHDQGFVIRDEAGRPLRLLGVARDVTARKLHEKRQQQGSGSASQISTEAKAHREGESSGKK